MHARKSLLITTGLVATVAGCNWLTPLVIMGEHKKKVSAEFDKLARTRVAILVWTDQATLFDYPYARFELAAYIGDKLTAEMGQRNLGTSVVDPRDVEDFLQRHPDAQINPQAVGKQFDADYVVYLEVLHFQIRDPQQPELLQGRIESSVAVHDIRAGPDRAAGRHELAAVQCVYPEGAPALFSATNSPVVRESIYRKFAEAVARKFYEHSVEL